MNPQYAEVARGRPPLRVLPCAGGHFQFPLKSNIYSPASGVEETEAELALACRSCNVHKAARISGTDPVSGTIVRLFNPRKDQWSEHFQAHVVSGEIRALTDIGRATIDRLKMNDEAQKTARRQWARLSLFP